MSTIGIVVIHLGRCGSTVLAELLGQHSQITWHGEIFEPMIKEVTEREGRDCRLEGDPVKLAVEKIEAADTRFSGLEVKPFHFDAFGISSVAFIDGMRQAGVDRFVVLDRRNRLRKVVSSRIAARSGIWHVKANRVRRGRPIALPVEEILIDRRKAPLKQLLERYDREFAEVRRLVAPDYLDLVYETDVQKDPKVAYRRLLGYLGLEEEPVEVTLGRTTTAPLKGLLKNYDEVAAHLAGSGFEWMLSEE